MPKKAIITKGVPNRRMMGKGYLPESAIKEQFVTYEEIERYYLVARDSYLTYIGSHVNLARFIFSNYVCDLMKEQGIYRQEVRHMMRQLTQKWDMYEKHLLRASKFACFKVKNFTAEKRAMYREDLTDEEFFEMWTAHGAEMFTHAQSLIFSFRYKYEKVLRTHEAPTPDILSWMYVVEEILHMSTVTYQAVAVSCARHSKFEKQIYLDIFEAFDTSHLHESMLQVISKYESRGKRYTPTAEEEKNIRLGYKQLSEFLNNQYWLYRTHLGVVLRYKEIYRNRIEHKAELAATRKEISKHRNKK